MTKIMIVEDEADICTLLQYNLFNAGFEVMFEQNGGKAIDTIRKFQPDLLLLDRMLPEKDGITICAEIRADDDLRNLPIIMLTALSSEKDKVEGLATGADDYVTKPFSVPELIARIRAMLRRMQPVQNEDDVEIYQFEDVSVDMVKRRVMRGKRYIHLGPTEFKLLVILIKQPRVVFSREALLKEVWGNDIHVELRTVDVHIRRLRKAMNEGGESDVIRTVRSGGYSIDNNIPEEELE
ncbi:MAG: response regulator [Alphaproteobacteria bacterium]|nr:response regulator [Alphaproteobacteria bacterium]